ncbi:MAG: hypothetical protein QXI58_01430 [Candidatus Micrarchaeia archaeon]
MGVYDILKILLDGEISVEKVNELIREINRQREVLTEYPRGTIPASKIIKDNLVKELSERLQRESKFDVDYYNPIKRKRIRFSFYFYEAESEEKLEAIWRRNVGELDDLDRSKMRDTWVKVKEMLDFMKNFQNKIMEIETTALAMGIPEASHEKFHRIESFEDHNVLIENLRNMDVLVYDEPTGKWKNFHWPSGGIGSPFTITIAAYNSKNKERADIVCDGVADEIEINNAINSLGTTGGIIYLMEGEYNLQENPIKIENKYNVFIYGKAKINSFTDKCFWIKNSENIRIEDFFLNEKVEVLGSSKISIKKIRTGANIEISSSSEYYVVDNYIEGASLICFGERGVISNNVIIGTAYDFGIIIGSGKNFLVSDNIIILNFLQVGSGIYNRAADDSIICNNLIIVSGTNEYLSGIWVNMEYPAVGNIIIGNQIISDKISLRLDGLKESYVVSNHCRGKVILGGGSYNNVLSNNYILGDILDNGTGNKFIVQNFGNDIKTKFTSLNNPSFFIIEDKLSLPLGETLIRNILYKWPEVLTPGFLRVDSDGNLSWVPGISPILSYLCFNDTPQEQPNGIRVIFTLNNNFVENTTQVYLNGLRQKLGDDYVELSPNQIRFMVPPSPGDIIVVDYIISG